jgi:hypothetical protein
MTGNAPAPPVELLDVIGNLARYVTRVTSFLEQSLDR